MALISLPLLISGIWSLVTGDATVWEGLLGLPLFGGLLAAALVLAWSQVPRRAPVAGEIRMVDKETVLLLPTVSKAVVGPRIALGIGVVLLGAGLCNFLASLDDDWSAGLAYLFLISLPGMFALLVGIGFRKKRKDTDRDGIAMTAREVILGFGGRPKVLAWQDISAVAARCEGKRSGRTNIITLVTGDRTVDIAHDDLATDPTRVYHLFVFYVRNPLARAELGTEVGLNRFGNGDYASTSSDART
ncbi:hypothetical protein [Nocardia sp. NPDC048505]|uniref:hypothetical protein n=1 Tax=unclassified Nocardia TaxID=2637762 RepID=UPI0034016C69